MTFKDYQEKALTTAVYPQKYAVIYPSLKLCEEAGEVAGKLGKCMRDAGDPESDAFLNAMKKEIGDVLWYLAALSGDFGFCLDDVAETNIKKLASRQKRGTLHGSGDDR
jgi:NTP pyrophosphatase (non-canonical NTP hydrolase)